MWYPLRRSGAFELLPGREKGEILREHATTGDPATCSPEDVCRYL